MKLKFLMLLMLATFSCKDKTNDEVVSKSTYKYYVSALALPADYEYIDENGTPVKGQASDSGYVYQWQQEGTRSIGIKARANTNVITPKTATVKIERDGKIIAEKTGSVGEYVELYGTY